MAAREHRVSRRALLGAAFLPLIGAAAAPRRHPGLDPGRTLISLAPEIRWTPDRVRGDEEPVLSDFEGWHRALARFRRAESVLKAAAHEPDEDRYDRILGRFLAALKRLLRTPAPDLPTLSLKIDLAIDHEIAELTGGDACLAALKEDARRLAGFLRSS